MLPFSFNVELNRAKIIEGLSWN